MNLVRSTDDEEDVEEYMERMRRKMCDFDDGPMVLRIWGSGGVS
ncbi:hypothetical protein HanIR_Chr10g0455211 [Helianthus annuus]|nr:hypothetical protein HanIR_Chr10g0455211 [Helianthus annuus]